MDCTDCNKQLPDHAKGCKYYTELEIDTLNGTITVTDQRLIPILSGLVQDKLMQKNQLTEAIWLLKEIHDWAWLNDVLQRETRITQREQKAHDEVTTRLAAFLEKVEGKE